MATGIKTGSTLEFIKGNKTATYSAIIHGSLFFDDLFKTLPNIFYDKENSRCAASPVSLT